MYCSDLDHPHVLQNLIKTYWMTRITYFDPSNWLKQLKHSFLPTAVLQLSTGSLHLILAFTCSISEITQNLKVKIVLAVIELK